MDEDKGKGSSTFTKAVSERLEEEVCKAHKINYAGYFWFWNKVDDILLIFICLEHLFRDSLLNSLWLA